MKHPFSRICWVALFFVIPSVQAQTSAAVPAQLYGYDIIKEVTVNGPVASMLAQPSPGMVMGAHLLVTTSSGPVDISLGAFGLRGKGALAVAPGQPIEVTGVMMTLKSGPVLLARTVKIGNQSYAIRNEHGIPVSPQAREHIGQKSAQSGETL
jgi:hypothetical protein